MSIPVRQYKLYIGYVKGINDVANNKVSGTDTAPKITTDMQSLPLDENFILLEGLQMKASINFSKEGTSSKNPKQTIEIINPSQKTTADIRNRNVVLLVAGYTADESLPVICATQIQSSELIKKGNTTTLKLTCADAYKVKRNVRITRTYDATLTYGAVIQDIVNQLSFYGVASNVEIKPLLEIQLKTSMSFADGIFEALDDILTPINYRWYMAASILYIEPKVKLLEKGDFTRVLTINEENVKDSIQLIQDTSQKDAAEAKADGLGIKVKLNLNGNASISDALRVTYGQYEGQYKITSVKHSLDYEGSAWDTEVECSKL